MRGGASVGVGVGIEDGENVGWGAVGVGLTICQRVSYSV